MDASVTAATEPYFAYLDGKMYYKVNKEAAPYIEAVRVRGFTNILPYWNGPHNATLDTTELPGVPGVYTTAITTSKGGWVIDSGADRKYDQFLFYLKDNTPDEILTKGITVDTWAREGNKVYQEFIYHQDLFVEELLIPGGKYAPDTKFNSNYYYEEVPALEDVRYDFASKSILGTYFLRKMCRER